MACFVKARISLMLSHGVQSIVSLACIVQMYRTNIMHSRKPSIVITPAASINNVNRYFYARSNKIRHISLKQLHLISLDIKTVKHLRFTPCTWRNRVLFERRSQCQKGSSCCCCDVMELIGEVDRGWGECIIPIGSVIYALNIRFNSRLMLSYLLSHLYSMLLKGLRLVARALCKP